MTVRWQLCAWPWRSQWRCRLYDCDDYNDDNRYTTIMTLITMTALYGDDTVDDSGVLHLPLEFMLYIKTRSVFFFFPSLFFWPETCFQYSSWLCRKSWGGSEVSDEWSDGGDDGITLIATDDDDILMGTLIRCLHQGCSKRGGAGSCEALAARGR